MPQRDSRVSFRRAKIDHFLERAAECLSMGRFILAREMLDHVRALDPENAPCRELEHTIDGSLKTLTGRKNGHSSNGNSNGGPLRRSRLILVVDQDERLLVSTVEALNKNGFHAAGAASFDEAVEMHGLVNPDAVVSEVNFESGPRGFDLYQWMRNDPRFLDTPFIFLASRIDRDTLIAGKRLGVDDFIPKPADAEVIVASVMNCLSRRSVAAV
jgi:PleD family two-component response regulator